TQAHPAAAEELAALVVEASGRATREQFLAEVPAPAPPIDRQASGWFESAAPPPGGPTVQRRVDRRTKRMEAYPPIDRTSQTATQAPGSGPAGGEGAGGGGGAAGRGGGGPPHRPGRPRRPEAGRPGRPPDRPGRRAMNGPGPVRGDAGGTRADRDRPAVDTLEHPPPGAATTP